MVDTPGYNTPAGTRTPEGDAAVARAFVAPASALLWVIGVNTNGTLSASASAVAVSMCHICNIMTIMDNLTNLGFLGYLSFICCDSCLPRIRSQR